MRAIILVLFLAGAASATTICQLTTQADFTTAIANEPEWGPMLGYAQQHHFDTTQLGDVMKCTRDDASAYYVTSIPNRTSSKDSGAVLYNPASPTGAHVRFAWKKGAHFIFIVTNVVTERVTLNQDGSVRRLDLLDFAGHHLKHLAASLQPTARSQLQSGSVCPIIDNAGCADYVDSVEACVQQIEQGLDPNGLANDALDLWRTLQGCKHGDAMDCIVDPGLTGLENILLSCIAQLAPTSCERGTGPDDCVTTVGCFPGHCQFHLRGGIICAQSGAPSPCDQCLDAILSCTWPSCMCPTTTTTTTTTLPCVDCPTEFCGVCGPHAQLGTPLAPGTGFGIFTSMNNCNQCCPQPVDVCVGCCFNRLTLGDLYCCPSSCSSDTPFCPQ